MSNKEFDKKIREMMEVHTEVPSAGSWDMIESALLLKKRAKLIYFKRAIYTTVAVAASLVLLLVLNRNGNDFNDFVKVAEQKDAIANLELERPIQDNPLQSSSKAQQTQNTPGQSQKTLGQTIKSRGEAKITLQTGNESKIPVKENISTEERVVIDEKAILKELLVAEEQAGSVVIKPESETTQSPAKSKSQFVYPTIEDYKSTSRRKSSPLIAFATNLSPSTGNNSVTLMAMSQIEGGLAANDVVSTIQKASVPQEVISNTKFLMPVSVGVQVQMPISKMFAVGLGVNYTMLFSNYDALSRQETRQTQQTLHYIGVPLNLYANIMQKDNLRLYATGGVTLEKGLYAFYRVSENGVRKTSGESIAGVQWSATAGLGVELAVNNSTGLYFDPTIAYYFDNNQPLNIRTSQPLQFKFELGFRFHL